MNRSGRPPITIKDGYIERLEAENEELRKTSPSGRLALQIGALKDENERLKEDLVWHSRQLSRAEEIERRLRAALEEIEAVAGKVFLRYLEKDKVAMNSWIDKLGSILTALTKENK